MAISDKERLIQSMLRIVHKSFPEGEFEATLDTAPECTAIYICKRTRITPNAAFGTERPLIMTVDVSEAINNRVDVQKLFTKIERYLDHEMMYQKSQLKPSPLGTVVCVKLDMSKDEPNQVYM